MERARSHLIDEAAEEIFRGVIPKAWVARKETPDYGIDFRVQIFEPKNPAAHADIFTPSVPTSERFAVQVKGIEDPKGDALIIKHRLETNPLEYYIDIEPEPVLLVVVDVHRREAFWVFLQKYVDDNLNDGTWRSQEKVTIIVPRSNRLVCDEAFRSQINLAIKYVSLRKPQNISTAILAEQERLEKIDPRFNVKMSIDESGVNRRYTLKPSATINWRFDFGGDMSRHEDFVRGKQVPFSPGEIEIDSPLYDAINEGGYIQVGKDMEAILLIAASDDPSNQLFLSGRMTRGIEGGYFESKPGAIQLIYKFRFNESHVCVTGSLSLGLPYWYGVPLLDLPRFEEVDRFFGGGERHTSNVTWILEGEPGTPGTMRLPSIDGRWLDVLIAVRKAREIARKIGINPALPANFGKHHKESIDKIHALMFNGEYRVPAPMGVFSIKASKIEGKSAIAHLGKARSTAQIIGSFPEECSLLGHPIDLVMTEVAFTHAQPKYSSKGKDKAEITFSGTSQSEIIYKGTKEALSVEESDRRFGRQPPRTANSSGGVINTSPEIHINPD